MARVRIEQGIVEGSEMSGVHAFLGMPYARAPIGDRRWQPPQPPDAWEGVRDATHLARPVSRKAGPVSICACRHKAKIASFSMSGPPRLRGRPTTPSWSGFMAGETWVVRVRKTLLMERIWPGRASRWSPPTIAWE